MLTRGRHAERGQVFPIWALGIVGMLVMVLMVVRYASVVQWQIRAQNAADGAAQAVLAMQTQQFNEMNATLYAASVEEYRIRLLIYGMELTSFGNGGCGQTNSCATRYASLYTAFMKATARYGNEVTLLNRITANLSSTAMLADTKVLIAHLDSTCGVPGGGDCAFSYALVDERGRTPLYSVSADARAFVKPSLGNNMTVASGVNPALVPAQVEVSVCADISSPVPSFLGFQPKPYRVIARAAATAVQVEQDWFQPGSLYNPWTGLFYQPDELASGSITNDGTGVDWYTIDFGGNANTASIVNNGYTFAIYTDEFSAYTGWWNSVPILPYMKSVTSTIALGCSS